MKPREIIKEGIITHWVSPEVALKSTLTALRKWVWRKKLVKPDCVKCGVPFDDIDPVCRDCQVNVSGYNQALEDIAKELV